MSRTPPKERTPWQHCEWAPSYIKSTVSKRRTGNVIISQSQYICPTLSTLCPSNLYSQRKQNPQTAQNKTQGFIVDILRPSPLGSCCRRRACCLRHRCAAGYTKRATNARDAVGRWDSVGTAALGIAIVTREAQDWIHYISDQSETQNRGWERGSGNEPPFPQHDSPLLAL